MLTATRVKKRGMPLGAPLGLRPARLGARRRRSTDCGINVNTVPIPLPDLHLTKNAGVRAHRRTPAASKACQISAVRRAAKSACAGVTTLARATSLKSMVAFNAAC